MSLTLFIGGSGATPTGVHFISHVFVKAGTGGTVYSGLKIDADGDLYERQPGGGWSSFGTWLLSGTNSAFYVNRTINSGSLVTDSGTGSSIILSTDRTYDVQRTGQGGDISQVDFEIALVSDDSVVASISYTFHAEIF